MKFRFHLCLALLFIFVVNSYGQVFSEKEAEKQGNSYKRLDGIYPSALHLNPILAVFKTPQEQENFQKAYIKFMQDLNAFLKANNFSWGKQTTCFNRIYFNANGVVDYFLYSFPSGQITPEKEKEFERLLKLFLKGHKFTVTAKENFSQSSPYKFN